MIGKRYLVHDVCFKRNHKKAFLYKGGRGRGVRGVFTQPCGCTVGITPTGGGGGRGVRGFLLSHDQCYLKHAILSL